MTAENLQNLLAQPYRIAESELEGLEELVTQYPYFQLGHLLIAKYAHDQESMLAPHKVRRAAVYAFERRLLRKLIHTLPSKELQQEGKPVAEDLGAEFKNSKSFFDLLPPIDLDESSVGYKPQAEKQQDTPEENNSTSKVIEMLKEPIETIWDNQLSEGDAIALFNVGKIEEAQQFYEELAKQYPEKATEYQQRWAVLISTLPKETEEEEEKPQPEDTKTPETETTPVETEKTENIEAFFEDIAVPEGVPDYLHYNEGIALGLYYDGKEREAIEMYKKLIEFYPEKKEYYEEQVVMLVGKKAYMSSFEPKPTALDVQGTETSAITLETVAIQEQASQKVEKEAEKTEVLPANTSKEEDMLGEIDEYVEEKETKQDDNIHSFFEHIGSPEALPEPTEVEQEAILTEEEKPFFEAIENLHAESVEADLPPIEVLRADLPTQDALTLDDEAIFLTESQAIAFFNQGKLEASINIYEQLTKQNPVKTAYYESQIRVLRETIRESLRPAKKAKIEARPTEGEDLSEDLAIRLFTQDRTAEAIAVYEQLIEHNPNKRMHYLRQIEVLKS